MTREEAASRAQSNADIYGNTWYAITHDGRSYVPHPSVSATSTALSYMVFEPRPLTLLTAKHANEQRQKGHTRK